MAHKLIGRRPRHDEVTAGEILVGLVWAVRPVLIGLRMQMQHARCRHER
jgi:hypothetical protein